MDVTFEEQEEEDLRPDIAKTFTEDKIQEHHGMFLWHTTVYYIALVCIDWAGMDGGALPSGLCPCLINLIYHVGSLY